MEIKTIRPESSPEEWQPRINVNIALTILPFGHFEIRETYGRASQEEFTDKPDLPSNNYVFPTDTVLTRIVTAPQPIVVITH